MRLLFDESVTKRLRLYLTGHNVLTVDDMGWKSRPDGQLLSLARDDFDVVITCDRSIPRQQNLTDADVALVVLRAGFNRVNDLKPLVPRILQSLETIQRGQIVPIYAEPPQ